MYEDLATLAPSAIVCVAFLWGIWALIRHEMAPKRVAREDEDQDALAGDSAPAGGTPAGSAPASGTRAGGAPAGGAPASGAPASGAPADGAASPAAARSATRSGEEAAASVSKHGEL